MEEVDDEAIVQAYVNIVTGACISLGKLKLGALLSFVSIILLNVKKLFS